MICLDEKSKQLLADSRRTLPLLPGKTAVQDYEYVRKGTRNIFVAVEPKSQLSLANGKIGLEEIHS
ncbi:MAG: hypothetical protein AAB489_05865 [Patescibacteria group bacterium]